MKIEMKIVYIYILLLCNHGYENVYLYQRILVVNDNKLLYYYRVRYCVPKINIPMCISILIYNKYYFKEEKLLSEIRKNELKMFHLFFFYRTYRYLFRVYKGELGSVRHVKWVNG